MLADRGPTFEQSSSVGFNTKAFFCADPIQKGGKKEKTTKADKKN